MIRCVTLFCFILAVSFHYLSALKVSKDKLMEHIGIKTQGNKHMKGITQKLSRAWEGGTSGNYGAERISALAECKVFLQKHCIPQDKRFDRVSVGANLT